MSNKKISALSLATTPLTGSEIVPINQSSVTDSVSVTNLTAGRAISAASLALTTSPLPTTSGGTNLTSFTANGVVYASSSSVLATGSGLQFDGTNFSTTGTAQSTGFYTVKSTASLSSTPTTLFTISGSAALYYVGVIWDASNPAAFTANAIIIWDGSLARIMQSANGTQVIISLSGANVQAVNNFTTATANWSYMKQSIA
jgi:hypothetical protein